MLVASIRSGSETKKLSETKCDFFYNKTLFNLFTLVRAELMKVWLTIIRF